MLIKERIQDHHGMLWEEFLERCFRAAWAALYLCTQNLDQSLEEAEGYDRWETHSNRIERAKEALKLMVLLTELFIDNTQAPPDHNQ